MKYLLTIKYLLLLSCWLCIGGAVAQGDKVQELFQKKEWVAASDLLQDMIAKGDNRPVVYNQLGTALLNQDLVERAEVQFSKAISMGFPAMYTYYNKSKYYASKGQAVQAAEMMSKSIDNGLQDLARVSTDKGFDLVRSSVEFKAVIEKLEQMTYPCKFDVRYRGLDFWIGEWNVIDYNSGAPLGKSKIEKDLNGCLVFEHWQDRLTVGKSFNYFDPAMKKWRQNWVDASGHVVSYTGEAKDDIMNYEGETIDKDGVVTKVRVSIKRLPDGSVRHTAENMVNGSWQKVFDGNYQKEIR